MLARIRGKDPLTGIANMFQFRRDLNSPAMRKAPTAAYLLADMDNFKRVNTIYGHDVGDQLLLRIAKQVFEFPSVGREIRRAYREGGESFCVLLSNIRTETALISAEGVRKHIEQLRLPGMPELQVTARIGLVIAILPKQGRQHAFENIMRVAHEMVYCAPEDKEPNQLRWTMIVGWDNEGNPTQQSPMQFTLPERRR